MSTKRAIPGWTRKRASTVILISFLHFDSYSILALAFRGLLDSGSFDTDNDHGVKLDKMFLSSDTMQLLY